MLKTIEQRVDEIRREGYEFRLTDYINRAIEVVKEDIGMMIVYTIILFVGLTIISLIGIIGFIIRILFQSALFMGYAYVANRIYYNKPVEISNYFDGIKDFGKLLVTILLQGAFFLLAAIPAMIYLFYLLLSHYDFKYIDPNNLRNYEQITELLKFVLTMTVSLLPMIYLTICFQLSFFLVVFARADYWNSIKWSFIIVNKKIFHFILLSFLVGMIIIISIIPCGLGLLVSIPFSFVMKYVLFHEILDFDNIQHPNRDEIHDYLTEADANQTFHPPGI